MGNMMGRQWAYVGNHNAHIMGFNEPTIGNQGVSHRICVEHYSNRFGIVTQATCYNSELVAYVEARIVEKPI
jgi:hypothetical protein